MSDSNLHQNTSEDQGVPSGAPATTGTAPAPENVPGEGEHKSKTFTRRSVLAMAGCGVAGLVVGGVLASWGVTSKSIASGRIEIRTTPTKMIVTDRARCSGCQRCEMACTLKNDGRVCQHIARVRVWPNYNFGTNVGSTDGAYGNCEFTVEHCKQCEDPACMNYCPVHRLRHVQPGVPVEHAGGGFRDGRVHEVHLVRPLRRAVPERRHQVHRLGGYRAEGHRPGRCEDDDPRAGVMTPGAAPARRAGGAGSGESGKEEGR